MPRFRLITKRDQLKEQQNSRKKDIILFAKRTITFPHYGHTLDKRLKIGYEKRARVRQYGACNIEG
jgi:hypothetical protein